MTLRKFFDNQKFLLDFVFLNLVFIASAVGVASPCSSQISAISDPHNVHKIIPGTVKQMVSPPAITQRTNNTHVESLVPLTVGQHPRRGNSVAIINDYGEVWTKDQSLNKIKDFDLNGTTEASGVHQFKDGTVAIVTDENVVNVKGNVLAPMSVFLVSPDGKTGRKVAIGNPNDVYISVRSDLVTDSNGQELLLLYMNFYQKYGNQKPHIEAVDSKGNHYKWSKVLLDPRVNSKRMSAPQFMLPNDKVLFNHEDFLQIADLHGNDKPIIFGGYQHDANFVFSNTIATVSYYTAPIGITFYDHSGNLIVRYQSDAVENLLNKSVARLGTHHILAAFNGIPNAYQVKIKFWSEDGKPAGDYLVTQNMSLAPGMKFFRQLSLPPTELESGSVIVPILSSFGPSESHPSARFFLQYHLFDPSYDLTQPKDVFTVEIPADKREDIRNMKLVVPINSYRVMLQYPDDYGGLNRGTVVDLNKFSKPIDSFLWPHQVDQMIRSGADNTTGTPQYLLKLKKSNQMPLIQIK